MTKEAFLILMESYLRQQLSEAALESFLDAADNPEFGDLLSEHLLQELQGLRTKTMDGGATPEPMVSDATGEPMDERARRIWTKVELATEEGKVVSLWRKGRRWYGYAAALILLVGIGALVLLWQAPAKTVLPKMAEAPDVQPGRNGAILTLGNGTHVSLDSAGKDVPVMQGGSKVTLQGSRLSYMPAATLSGTAALVYNTITTPRGRQFTLVLPDGSSVWLNAASSIRFPTAFDGKERRVELSGEAYFEIAKDKSKPFLVQTDSTETEVLGTSFNISAYREDGVTKTTLVEGRVRTGSRQEKVILEPGQQAKYGQGLTVERQADIEQTVAWKNGLFNFQNARLKEVMRQLARWYDLDIVYDPGVRDMKFGGEMSRNIPLSSLLKGLKEMDVHFRIEQDHRLIVMP